MRHDTEHAALVIAHVARMVIDLEARGPHTRAGAIERVMGRLPSALRDAIAQCPTLFAEALDRGDAEHRAFEDAIAAGRALDDAEDLAEARDRARVLRETARG